MNESQPFGASATASTRSAAKISKRRWLPRIKRVGFWRALGEYSVVGGLLTFGSMLLMWYVSSNWGYLLSFMPIFLLAPYAWRLKGGTGKVWRRVGRVLLWIALATVLPALAEWIVSRWLPPATTPLMQLGGEEVVTVRTLLLGAILTIAFFVPIRVMLHLQTAGRQQLRWQLTYSYMLVSVVVVIMIPVAVIVILAVLYVVVAPSLPQFGATPAQAADALAPLVERNAGQAELTTTLQGILNGDTRLPATAWTFEIESSPAPSPAPSAPALDMQLTDVERLTLVDANATVLASVGQRAHTPGTPLPAGEQAQITLLLEHVRAGGCREGGPAQGSGADRAVCAIGNTPGAPQTILLAEASAIAPEAVSYDFAQVAVAVLIGGALVLLLTPLAMLVILPVAGGGVGYFLAGRLTKRLQLLTAAAGDIAAGDLQRRVPIDSEDEVGRLATDFNTMAAKLAEREHALAEAAQRAEHLLRANKRLIVDVSHELRTPLTTVRGYLEALTHEHGDKLPQRDLQVIDGELQRLTHLIEDLFTLARTEAQQLPLQIGPTDACALANKLVDALAPLARRERQIEMIAALPATLPPVCADQARLEQVLQNLIQNALRYTPAGGIVALEATATDDHVTLSVADTGMGIDPTELPRVWERFYRSDRSRARETGGAGLGLALVKELVTAMGGTISAESTLGRGSKFSITLRRAK